MDHLLPMVEARSRLTTLPEELEQSPETGAIAITRRGKPVLAVMSWELYEALIETLDILSDAESLKAFRQGVSDIEQGKTVSWKTAKKQLLS